MNTPRTPQLPAPQQPNLVQVVEDMIILLEQENHAVKSSDFGAFEGLQQRKVDLFAAIHDLATEADMQGLKPITLQAGAADKLKGRLNDAVENNRKTLEIAGKSMGRLLDRIASAARDAALENRKYYGASGAFSKPQGSSLSITLNENA